MSVFTIDMLNRYLCEADAPKSAPAGFELVAGKDKDGFLSGYKVMKGSNPVCILQLTNNANEEYVDFREGLREPTKVTVYITQTKNRVLCDEFKKKLELLTFPNVVERDADKKIVPEEV
jgi:hypothetical protein